MKFFILCFFVAILISCTQKKCADKMVLEIADSYYEHLLSTCRGAKNGGEASDLPIIRIQNSEKLMFKENYEDSIYNELLKVNKKDILKKSNLISYLVLKEELESSIGLRICKRYLWNVNPKSGIHIQLVEAMEGQIFENDVQKEEAIEKWSKIPESIQAEIANLEFGIQEGYTMPTEIVRLVIKQLGIMLKDEEINSNFLYPALLTKDKEFLGEWKKLIENSIIPSLTKYRNYLQSTYLRHARDNVSILALPNGEECYNALIRKNTSLNITGQEIHGKGRLLVLNNKKRITEWGEELYGTDDFKNILCQNKQAGKDYFHSENEVLNYVDSILSQAKSKCNFWFENIPNSKIELKPYHKYEGGAGAYIPAVSGKPAFFKINTSFQMKETKADCEILTYHETYPGHHLQLSYADSVCNLHPVVQELEFEVFDEGWARYSESLAEEMGLYSDFKSFIERRSWMGRAMVIDTGVNLYGWTKKDVIDYVGEVGLDEKIGTGLYYRSIFRPAQLTSYDIGGIEFQSMRNLSEEQLQEQFDIKQFHSKLLENTSVPISVLRYSIDEWMNNMK